MKINKNLFIRSLLALLSLFLITQANCTAQEKLFLSLKKTPIEILIDSTSPKKGQWGDYVINFKSKTNTIIEVQRIDASSNEIGETVTITKAQGTMMYIIPIYELLVGYDYCIVIRENPFSCFISDKFNMNDSEYSFCKKNFNLDRLPFYVTILEKKNKKKEKVRLKKIIPG